MWSSCGAAIWRKADAIFFCSTVDILAKPKVEAAYLQLLPYKTHTVKAQLLVCPDLDPEFLARVVDVAKSVWPPKT